ncbi:MAG TPA: TonB-dependent receptor [Thermoanaerobaculia bacterium]|nr:TonB-dependent receptor [Thermoanaerobaculia bacterium]
MRARLVLARPTAIAISLALCLGVAGAAWGQIPNGELTGRVTSPDGQGLPGVLVSASSPSLQGTRTTQTGANGDYKIPFLPPGDYRAVYQLEGFATEEREVRISAAQTVGENVSLSIAAVEEQLFVTGESRQISETSTAQATYTVEEVGKLAIARTPVSLVSLAAGTAQTGPNNATVISGAMSFENLWLVNGVAINENVRGGPLNLFIEDAVQEATVTTGGVSAEYGRFTGGVVNVITKSGANQITGSFRTSFANQDWESSGRERVFNPDFEPEDEITETFEATLGGAFWRDHIWFFLAGRDVETSTIEQTAITGLPFPQTNEQQRYEAKLTVGITSSHSLVGSYLEIDQVTGNSFFTALRPLDLGVLSDRGDPQEIKAFNYTGVLTPNFFVEAQYSERDFDIGVNSGGPRDLVRGSVWQTTFDNTFWHAPFFCGQCEQEVRNNENKLVKANYFLSTAGAGSHDLAFGYDTFKDVRFSINHQSGSDFRLATDARFQDDAGNVYPVVTGTGTSWVSVWPVFGLERARPTDFDTNSFYVNDRWQLNDKWSFNLGVRYDENDGRDAGGNLSTDDSKVSPRLAVSYDTKGDGNFVINATTGRYVAAVANTRADATATGGALGRALLFYRGAPINPNGAACLATGTCIDSRTAAQMFIDWWLAETGFNPITDPPENISSIPAEFGLIFPSTETNRIIPDTIKSPSTDEITLGFTKRLRTKGLVRADLIWRDWTDFYSDVVRPNNTIPIAGRPQDLVEVGNFGNDVLSREYLGLQTQLRYRVNNRLTTAATYTLSELEGNINGETAGSGPISESFFDRPEYKETRWNLPDGRLGADQKHKLRAWAIYDILQGQRQNLNVSLLQSFFSGTPYGAVGAVASRNFVTNPGYVTTPATVTYFFTDRDAFTTDDVTRTDFALTYSFSWRILGKAFEVFLTPQVLNVFDEDGVGAVNTGVSHAANNGTCPSSPTGRCLAFNPFVETPVEGTHWRKGDEFGEPVGAGDFQTPRTFRFSVGFRF